jgi:ABC-type dipeptide/oligopeptide/nickel transport system permease component/ABC-type transport system substrate-binding protein
MNGRFRNFLPFLLYLGAAAFLFGIYYGAAWMVRPDLRENALPQRSAEEIAAAERLRDTTIDPENLPVIQRDVDYAEGSAGRWFPRGEAPILAELVREGQLPPVAERVGLEPLVLDGVDGIGNYGGSWYRVAPAAGDVSIISWRLSGSTLVRWSPLGYPIRPNVAKGWEVSEDSRVFTFHLRRGMRWSDGHPFTADDIIYWWERDQLHFDVIPSFMRVGRELGTIEKLDDYTVRFTFPEPYAVFLERLTVQVAWALPRHYLEQYHPAFGDQELIQRAMRQLQLNSPLAVYNRMKDHMNPECPRLWPWIYRTHTSSHPYTFVRNPYYWAVDPEGNQLPYIDRVVFDVKAPNLIADAASKGEISFQLRNIKYEDYTLLMSQRERSNYDVYHWAQATRSVFAIFPNINRRVDPSRPETGRKNELLNQAAFRQALSLAINRADIIRAEFNNQTEVSQIHPGPGSGFEHPELAASFSQFDPDQADQLLDGLGLTRRDSEGFRTFADGSRMTFFINVTDFTGSGPLHFVIDDWARVGVRAIIREKARSLFQAEQTALEHDFSVWSGESEFFPLLQPRTFVPTAMHSWFAPGYGLWWEGGGFHGDPRVDTRPGAFGPPEDHPTYRGMALLDRALKTPDREVQGELVREILEMAAENVWAISISTPPPQLVIVKRGLRNFPRNAMVGFAVWTPAFVGIETFYWEEPSDSPSVIAQIKREMTTITPEPRARRLAVSSESGPQVAPPSSVGAVGYLVNFLVFGALGLGLLLVSLRHPFVARRLFIMVPTMLIISVVAFVIIQLPPGNFLEARIQELQMTGDESAMQQVQDLREMFHMDDSSVQRYARWLGLHWFVTFDSSDRGLLQGNLGRSMENGRLVNDIVGDRITLTVLISLFTILFTWALALPIGIYSAVRQYSWGDYLFTFVGFLGMCIPNFLLALLLMYWADVYFGWQISGLFSAEFAAQPGWTWPKFVDMMKHVWVPVVVLGTGGTASMIRIMRGNLLDELRKPYVTTARAKGVRPLKLLMKYPVRLALNPFISGIGSIFPQLVSGGAIVAIVLSLPMVGPLMLTALMAQDMYLAGSMLMVLSLLGIFGTLVSDLLLLLLDPRIRLEGGTSK